MQSRISLRTATISVPHGPGQPGAAVGKRNFSNLIAVRADALDLHLPGPDGWQEKIMYKFITMHQNGQSDESDCHQNERMSTRRYRGRNYSGHSIRDQDTECLTNFISGGDAR